MREAAELVFGSDRMRGHAKRNGCADGQIAMVTMPHSASIFATTLRALSVCKSRRRNARDLLVAVAQSPVLASATACLQCSDALLGSTCSSCLFQAHRLT
jgi:hypothetical protein